MDVENEKIFTYKNQSYKVDELGYLINFEDWDENYAEGIAISIGMVDNLTEEHWKIIRYIRSSFIETKECPTIYTTCRKNNLKLADLRKLFPTGYQRGACKIAGISYKENYLRYYYWDNQKKELPDKSKEKHYLVDSLGFLIRFEDWDPAFAIGKAIELKIPNNLEQMHWEIIRFMRSSYQENKKIPTVYELCEKFFLEIEDLEKLFPDGYHRGVIKISGLRLK